jgi:hypothetical protein
MVISRASSRRCLTVLDLQQVNSFVTGGLLLAAIVLSKPCWVPRSPLYPSPFLCRHAPKYKSHRIYLKHQTCNTPSIRYSAHHNHLSPSHNLLLYTYETSETLNKSFSCILVNGIDSDHNLRTRSTATFSGLLTGLSQYYSISDTGILLHAHSRSRLDLP